MKPCERTHQGLQCQYTAKKILLSSLYIHRRSRRVVGLIRPLQQESEELKGETWNCTRLESGEGESQGDNGADTGRDEGHMRINLCDREGHKADLPAQGRITAHSGTLIFFMGSVLQC